MTFELLLNKISGRLKKMARYYNSYGTFSDSDDLFQEMSVYLWQHYRDGLPEGINETYVIQGCRLHILNHLRKEREKAQTFSLEQPLGENKVLIENILPNQEEALDRSAERSIVFEQIRNNGFTKREKEVLNYLLGGFTIREIGSKLGISHVMVVKYKQRLINKWQRSYQRQ